MEQKKEEDTSLHPNQEDVGHAIVHVDKKEELNAIEAQKEELNAYKAEIEAQNADDAKKEEPNAGDAKKEEEKKTGD